MGQVGLAGPEVALGENQGGSNLLKSKLFLVVAAICACFAVAACGSSSKSSSSSAPASSGSSTSAATTASSSSSSSGTPTISASSFNNTFTALNVLQSLGKSGKGKVAAILPDTTSSTRYV